MKDVIGQYGILSKGLEAAAALKSYLLIGFWTQNSLKPPLQTSFWKEYGWLLRDIQATKSVL